jgi:Ni/Co efflux regulator RcnB
MVVDL